jgi:hypothetical protein
MRTVDYGIVRAGSGSHREFQSKIRNPKSKIDKWHIRKV